MSADRLLLIARLRAGFTALALLLPWWLALRMLWLSAPSFALDALAVAVLAAATLLAASRRDRRWLARRLNARRAEFDDSAELLWPAAAAGVLATLQRRRLQQRLATLPLSALMLGPPWRLLGANLAAAAALVAAVLALSGPTGQPLPAMPTMRADGGSEASAPRLHEHALRIEPPAYTALPVSHSASLDARVAEGSTLRWQLRFTAEPSDVSLRFLDGSELSLQPNADRLWQGSRRIERASGYRLLVDGAVHDPAAAAQRIEVIADRPPQIQVSAPAQTLTLLDRARTVELLVEASDDYGLGAAEVLLTHAQGDGENVQFAEHRLPLAGSGSARQRRYRQQIDLAALGLAEGDDLILRVLVEDNRQPLPQQSQSPAYILRWPRPAAAAMEGFEGLVQHTLPAYFRSQRQIIIDSEGLLERRPQLAADSFVQQSDAIGVDQRLLRLRYGQFLGEESELGEMAGPDHNGDDDEHEHDGHGHGHDHDHDHAHDPAPDTAAQVIAEYGHSHDIAEAATLFDPATRELLRAALREMWSSELHLRQGAPDSALPYQYRALDFIKAVQQASRIHLARVGLELPPIDFDRRLSGDRSMLRPRPDPLPVAPSRSEPVEQLWQALDPLADAGDQPGRDNVLAAFVDWLRAEPEAAEDPLALLDAAETLQLQPTCEACAARLRAQLAPLRPLPATAVQRRPVPTDHAYLDALQAQPR
jgi:hypothetical protein